MFKVVPGIMEQSFRADNVAKSWEDCGRFPFNVKKIMSFRSLSVEKQNYILNYCIPTINEEFDQKGMADEQFYYSLLNEQYDDIDNCPTKVGMPLNDMATSRQRAKIMNHEYQIDVLDEKRRIKQMNQDNFFSGLNETHKKRRTNCLNCSNTKDILKNNNKQWKI